MVAVGSARTRDYTTEAGRAENRRVVLRILAP